MTPHPSVMLKLATAPVLLILFAACSGSGEANVKTGGTKEVSTQCSDAMETMRLGYEKLGDFTNEQADEANALELLPLNACSDADEWVAAARANPAAVGLSGGSFVKPETDLGVRCHMDIPGTQGTPVCVDAIATGIVSAIPAETTAAPVTSKASEVDDSAALNVLALAPGALFAMIEKPAPDSCNSVAFIPTQLNAATPAESYRGRYEQVSSKMAVAAQLCGTVEGQTMAQQARTLAVAILDERAYLNLKWGGLTPVPAL